MHGINLTEESGIIVNYGAMHIMPIELKIINSSGAGDTAVAAFLSAILDGENPESSH